MTVQKFRTIEEMSAARVATRDHRGEAPFDRFLRHCARWRRIAPQVYTRGVFKFRTLAEAQAARSRSKSR